MSALLLLILLALIMDAARSFTPHPSLNIGAAAVALSAGFLLLAAFLAGDIFERLGLPRLTGYLAAGVLAGPHVLNLVSLPMLADLSVFNGVAISLIALTAGTEMDFRTLRPLLRTVLLITLIGVVGAMVVIAGAAYLGREFLPFLEGLDRLPALAVAAVLGVTMAAQSPAIVVALRDETDAEGPLSKTVLGVVIVADLVVITMFAGTSAVAKAMLGGQASGIVTASAMAWEIFGSIVLGLGIGVLLAGFFRFAGGGGALFLVVLGFVMAEVGRRISLDPLLLALAAGMFVRNATRWGNRLQQEVDAASLPIYITFFAVAGASVHLPALAIIGIPAAAFVVIRAAALLTGTAVATRWAGAPDAVRRYAGFGLLPQAGLALALALLFAREFPSLGAEAGALVFAVVAINELLAPVAYRMALIRSGEAGQRTRFAETPGEEHPALTWRLQEPDSEVLKRDV
jgi:Kef-type K+ transport system membrane component KefB